MSSLAAATSTTGWVPNDARMTFDRASHTYRLGDRRLVSVTQVLGLVGLADFSGPWFTDEIKDRGRRLHEAIALDVEEQLDESTLDADIIGSFEGWRRFLRETDVQIEHWETPVCDPALGVAGTIDGLVRITLPGARRSERTVLDVKRAWYPCAAIQLAAYADMAAPLYDGPVYFRRAALVLSGDGGYLLRPCPDPLDRARWQAAVLLTNWRREHHGILD